MAETKLTVRQIMDMGLWSKVCEYKGWDEWIVNEGRIDEDELVTFDSTFQKPKEERDLSYEEKGEQIKELLNCNSIIDVEVSEETIVIKLDNNKEMGFRYSFGECIDYYIEEPE